MKCLDCPLCVSDYCDACGDGDIYCLITGDYAKDEGGCRRTNKFILSQDKQKLKDKRLEEECKIWSAIAEEYEKENPGFFSFGQGKENDMVRYINKDEFIAQIQDNFCTECNNYDGVKCRSCGIDDTIEMVENADEADVVPKSEVVLASSDAVKMLIECHGYALTHDADIKEEVAREIFAEIEKYSEVSHWNGLLGNPVLCIGVGTLAELKKKYTEEQE